MINKIKGCLAGLMIGDAMGMPSSMMTPQQIVKTYGTIDHYVDPTKNHLIHEELSAGEGTDDTVMAFQVIDEMIVHQGNIEVDGIVQRLKSWAKDTDILDSPIIGPSTKASLKGLLNDESPETTGLSGQTNGAAMKCAPLGLMHTNIQTLKQNVYNAALPSHNTSIAMSGALAIAAAVSAAFYQNSLEAIVEAAMQGANIGSKMGQEVPSPSVAKRIRLAYDIAQKSQNAYEGAKEIYDLIGASMATSESVPAALGYLILANGDPVIAIKLAINTGDDADTIGAMVGAIGGALKGIDAFPNDWLDSNKVPQLNNVDERVDKIYDILNSRS